MAKFKILLKVKELEVAIEGEREVLPQISHGLQKQLGGMLSAPIEMAVRKETDSGSGQPAEPVQPIGRSRTPRRSGGKSDGDSAGAVDFKHDVETFGTPKQAWSGTQKAIWLLSVVPEAHKQMSLGEIFATYNKHFPESGALNRGNLKRDLGKAKMKTPTPLGEDRTKTPSKWYLTEEGKRQADALVKMAKGGAAVTE